MMEARLEKWWRNRGSDAENMLPHEFVDQSPELLRAIVLSLDLCAPDGLSLLPPQA